MSKQTNILSILSGGMQEVPCGNFDTCSPLIPLSEKKERRNIMLHQRFVLIGIVVLAIVLAVVLVSLVGPGLINALIKMHMGN